ncbi:MAG: four helix bundle protein [Candidatus Peregrinibacteria bacterium]
MDDLDIPILRMAYELYKTFHGLRSIVSKADRYTLWQRAENLILDSIEGIFFASQLSKAEKLPHLERVSAKLNMLRIFLRLTKDTKLLDLKKCLLLQEIVDEIGRMLGGWMKSVKEQKTLPPSDSSGESSSSR